MTIKKAGIEELPKIKKLTEKCAAALRELEIFQWNEHYPSLEKLREDIEKQELYSISEAEELLGIIVISEKIDDEYLAVKWLTESTRNLYIHRLAVNPENWGQGIARNLMDFAEDLARKGNFLSVRLDTFSQNLRNQKFYEARGYQRLEDIYFPKQSEYPFHCYELKL
ncbi:MAG: GNAT family N-acetyltransferase [Christiangramia sp.]|uniref:GNAT family N-acetyltransferase n=1 Tax=Christiangramia sp. TaxID=1931228 RepID=UPI003242EEE8